MGNVDSSDTLDFAFKCHYAAIRPNHRGIRGGQGLDILNKSVHIH